MHSITRFYFFNASPSILLLKIFRGVGWAWWLKMVILVIWEAESRKIAVQSQPWEKIHKTPSHPVAYACHPSYTGTHK
jgi:hypothetical protein